MTSDQHDEQVDAASEALNTASASREADAIGARSGSEPLFGAGGGDDLSRQRDSEDDDLRDSLAALSRLSSHDLRLEDLLTRVAVFAVRAIPGAEGAGLTLLERSRRDTVVATATFVTEVDDIQYGLGQGPCIDAVKTGSVVITGSVGSDQRWPRFGGHVARLGIHSVISLPLITPEGPVGAMNVYARGKHVFDERAAELGELFATPAAIAVQNAHMLANAQRLADRLRSAAETQSIIDQAIGIIIARSGGSAAEARARLQSLSQGEHRKLAEVARQMVDEAARRARARRLQQGASGNS